MISLFKKGHLPVHNTAIHSVVYDLWRITKYFTLIFLKFLIARLKTAPDFDAAFANTAQNVSSRGETNMGLAEGLPIRDVYPPPLSKKNGNFLIYNMLVTVFT